MSWLAIHPYLMVGGPLHGNWTAVPDQELGRIWYFPLLAHPVRVLLDPKDFDMNIEIVSYRLERVADKIVLLTADR